MTRLDTRVAEALGRAAVYTVLATAFDRPTPERLQTLGVRAETAARGARTTADVGAALGRLAAAAAGADAGAVVAEHATLLDGPVRCSPYEGAWGPRQMAGKAAQLADVAGFYTAFGLAPTTWNAELEDHVGAECEFAAALALREAHALATGSDEALAVTRAAAAAFLDDHLGRWAPSFAEALGREAGTPVYRAAAALLSAWLVAETARVGVSPARATAAVPAEEAPFTCPMAPPDAPGD